MRSKFFKSLVAFCAAFAMTAQVAVGGFAADGAFAEDYQMTNPSENVITVDEEAYPAEDEFIYSEVKDSRDIIRIPSAPIKPIELEVTDEEAEALLKLTEKNFSNDSIVTDTKDSSYLYTSDFFYSQLSNADKKTYQQMATDMDSMLYGTQDLEYDTIDGFHVIATYEVNSSYDTAYALSMVFDYSNPQYFFIDAVLPIDNDGKIYIALLTYDDYHKGSVRAADKAKIDSITNSWLNIINACPDTLSKEAKIAELICTTSSYNLDETGEAVADSASQTIKSCLIDKATICAGFSKTFTYFCHKVGIPAVGITSDVHAWNYVQINNKWYETCITVMNQSYTNYYNDNYINYKGFNRGTNQLYTMSGNDSTYKVETPITNVFSMPSRSYDMPVYFYSRVDTKSSEGDALIYWKNIYGASKYAFYAYADGVYKYVGSVNSAEVIDSNYTVINPYGSATIKGLTPGKKYGFLVRAQFYDDVNKKNVWTGFTNSSINYATIADADSNKPVITNAKSGDGQVALNWTAVEGATNYAVYTRLNGVWTIRGTRTVNGMYVRNLVNGTKYGFAVKAYVNGAWTTVSSSDIVYATPVAAVVKPVITNVKAGDGQVALNWTAVEGATQYRVYSYLNGKWTSRGTRTVTGMYARNLVNGTEYGFAVKAYVNGAWTTVSSSDIVYATPNA